MRRIPACTALCWLAQMSPSDWQEVSMALWQRILVPVDFSETSTAAVQQAVELAKAFRASLLLLHVDDKAIADAAIEFPLGLDASLAERERLLKILSPLEQAELHPEFVMVSGSPAVEIVRCASGREVDVIVMGTHGRRGISHAFSGSVAEAVLRKARCPVLTVRSPKFGPGHRRVTPAAISPVMHT